MTNPDQKERALRSANARRWALQHIKEALHDGNDSVVAILQRREPVLSDMPIIDVIRLISPSRRITGAQHAMTRHAVNNHINLATPLNRAPDSTIKWCINYINAHPRVCCNHGKRRAHLHSA